MVLGTYFHNSSAYGPSGKAKGNIVPLLQSPSASLPPCEHGGSWNHSAERFRSVFSLRFTIFPSVGGVVVFARPGLGSQNVSGERTYGFGSMAYASLAYALQPVHLLTFRGIFCSHVTSVNPSAQTVPSPFQYIQKDFFPR